jgi:hypothetical protein
LMMLWLLYIAVVVDLVSLGRLLMVLRLLCIAVVVGLVSLGRSFLVLRLLIGDHDLLLLWWLL